MNDEKALGADAAAVETAGQEASDAAPHVAHTPGPWRVEPCNHGGMLLKRGDQFGPWTHVQSSLQILPTEDAHLIAAAPEMKEALEQIKRQCAGHADEFSGNVYLIADAALAKAEGREP